MYFLAKKYLKNKELSVLCATVFSLSQYIFSDVFRRSAIGESVAMIFFLIMFIAIYNMLHENYTKPWLYSIAFTGMVLSHMTTLIISAVVMVIVVLANSKKLFKDKSFWIKTGIAFGLFLITSLYSLASFVELYFHDTYEISDPWTFPSLNSHTILDMIGITSNYGVGVVCLLAFVLRFFIKKTDENKEELKQVDKFLIISAIVLAIVSSWFPWKYLDGLLSFLQFPWRLNTIASIMLSISLVILLKNLKNTNFKAFKIIGYLMMLFVFVYNNFALISFCSRSPYTTERSYALEWLPTNVDLFVLEKQQVLNDNGESVEYSRKQYVSDINFNCSSDSDYYIVPLIYYKGYKATLVKTNGETVELETTKDQTGLVHILTNGEEGEVLVCYAGTMIQSVTFIISLSSVVVIAIGTICYVIVKKRKQGSNSTEKVAQN